MIEINLLPEELRKKESGFQKIDFKALNLQNLPFLNIAIIVVAILIVAHSAIFLIGTYYKKNFNSLSRRYDSLMPEKRKADLLKAESESINKKMASIDELMVKRFKWAKKMNDLSDAMIPGIWLTELSYDEKLVGRSPATQRVKEGAPSENTLQRYLVLSGYAMQKGEEGTALVGKFIKSLKDSANFYSDFSDIELGVIKSDKVENQEVMNFKITCFFKGGR